MASSSAASDVVRSWRTALLTLRDEALASPPPAALLCLLRAAVLSHPLGALAAAASELPPHEVVSDVVFLAELGSAVSKCEGVEDTILQLCDLIHNVSCKVRMEVSSSLWTVMLDFLEKVVDCFQCKSERKRDFSSSLAGMKCLTEIIDLQRYIVRGNGKNYSSLDNMILTKLLLRIVSSSYVTLLSHSSYNPWENNSGSKTVRNTWELHTIAFSMMADAFSRSSSFVSADLWQSALEVLRKLMDFLASKNLLLEGYEMSRFYAALLDCLHLVLSSSKVSVSEHVAGFVVTLQMFLTYGLNQRSPVLPGNPGSKVKEFTSSRLKSGSVESRKVEHSRYVPPHLRKRGLGGSLPSNTPTSDYESSQKELTSSDSEHSDSDRAAKDGDVFRSSKTRIAALVCIQDLCQADPKSLTSIWTMLLPTNDVLQPRKCQGTLMACLLFDPALKTRMASTSALATILESHSSVFLQVAEYKDSSKCESFTTLSSSLGQILMQMHRGILHLIQRETHGGLLASLFKVLILLISATPYSRMPGDLLPTVVTTIWNRIIEGPTPKADQTSLMGTAFSCLTATMSTSPSQNLAKILEEDASTGLILAEDKSGKPNVLSVIFQFFQRNVHPTIRFEALQALRALLHNYPNVAIICWETLSANLHQLLQSSLPEESGCDVAENLLIDLGNTLGSANERCTMAAIKVLDEGLRAASGFQGTDSLLECRLLDIQLLSDSTRTKRVSSAPSRELSMLGASKANTVGHPPGAMQWNEVIDKHLSLVLLHGSPMIRAAAITCFAGMTSSVFFSLEDEKQKFIINSIVFSALDDKIPSVRAAACRAIGVIACFPQIFGRSKVLDDIVHAVEYNTHDPLISVRITSSWALANICDSLRHRATDFYSEDPSCQVADPEFILILFECALRLTKDGDKIKSNAVRALGNLSRFVSFYGSSALDIESVEFACSNMRSQRSQSFGIHRMFEAGDSDVSHTSIKSASLHAPHMLQKMVQAFVSCVTTGNVKVQWNVCHALGNLFLNKTLKLPDASWATSVYSILLLLLRDSTNFKIRIHAAFALAVPASRVDYGSSFSDIVLGLEHVLESLVSEGVLDPSSFKYRDALENQLALTMLHVLGLASSEVDQALRDFLVKKASFLEQWLSTLCSLLLRMPDQLEAETSSAEEQRKESTLQVIKRQMILRAANSLSQLYKSSNHNSISQRFEKLADKLS